jgi:hypothetical protein
MNNELKRVRRKQVNAWLLSQGSPAGTEENTRKTLVNNTAMGTPPQDESPSFRPSFLHSAQFRQPQHFIVSGYETALFRAHSTHLKLANQCGVLGHA